MSRRLCWCGWTLLEPRFMFATHRDWHLDQLRISRNLTDALASFRDSPHRHQQQGDD